MTIVQVQEEYQVKGMVSKRATEWLIKKVWSLDSVNTVLHKQLRKQAKEVERLKGELDHALLKLGALEAACGLDEEYVEGMR